MAKMTWLDPEITRFIYLFIHYLSITYLVSFIYRFIYLFIFKCHLFSDTISHDCNIYVWNWPNTMTI